MYIKIKIKPKNKSYIVLPIHYNHIIQGFIYNNIDENLAEFLHEKGYLNNKRSFKMFTFSNVKGKYKINKKKKEIVFEDQIELLVSSPIEKFCRTFASNMLIKEEHILNNQQIEIVSIEVKEHKRSFEKLRLLSPIVMYSTIKKENGKKYTYYYRPGDAEYNELITNNLRKKYKSYYNKEPDNGLVKIMPINNLRFNLVKYKGFIIKGYTGLIKISGPKDLVKLGMETGLGSKNSQGFGFVKAL